VKARLAIVAIALAGLAAVIVRVEYEGRSALADGDEALAAKHPGDAIAAWESAARWYLPGAGHVDDAYARLVAFAREHKSMTAWRAVRTAALATRSLWTPHEDDLAEANAAIAQLSVDDPDAGALTIASGPGDRGERLAWHAAQLGTTSRPAKIAAALAILGILAWLAGIVVVIRRGVSAHGKLLRRPAAVGAAISVAGIVVWAAGLYSA
jgi:hypothetical protein